MASRAQWNQEKIELLKRLYESDDEIKTKKIAELTGMSTRAVQSFISNYYDLERGWQQWQNNRGRKASSSA